MGSTPTPLETSATPFPIGLIGAAQIAESKLRSLSIYGIYGINGIYGMNDIEQKYEDFQWTRCPMVTAEIAAKDLSSTVRGQIMGRCQQSSLPEVAAVQAIQLVTN